MKILGFTAENFKRIRIVEIRPKGHLTQITGKNNQGKTSVLDAMWALFGGKKAIPAKPVRHGAKSSKLTAVIGDEQGKPLLIAKRIISGDRTTNLTVEAAPGAEPSLGGPQSVLDALIGEMSFDPVAFIHAEIPEQIKILRTIVKVDVDLDELTAQNKADYEARTIVNREVTRLRTEAAAITVQQGLPKTKQDDAPILQALTDAGQRNLEARRLDNEKAKAEDAWKAAQRATIQAEQSAESQKAEIHSLELQLASARQKLITYQEELLQKSELENSARSAWLSMPNGEMVDVAALTTELQAVQLANREIDKRNRHEELVALYTDREREAAMLSRQIEDREERKRKAFESAKIPVDGLAFTDEGVWFKGIPLSQLGEAQQIYVSLSLAMAANPKLRAVPIHHGESLDDEAIEMIEKLAEENDFQIFMAKVDSTGSVGIVMSDGMVESDNYK
jgi:predicted ATP-dependent endonuclease of OLD family